MSEEEKRKSRFFELLTRYSALGRLLPSKDEVEAGESHAGARMILAEMASVQREIEAILAVGKRKRG